MIVQYHYQSCESLLLSRIFPSALYSADYPSENTSVHDIAICVGNLNYSYPARRKVLFVFGSVNGHRQHGFDIVVVTSQKAVSRAKAHFGYKTKVFLAPPPILNLEAGARRLLERQDCFLHASPLKDATAECWFRNTKLMKAWYDGSSDIKAPLFDVLEFNSMVRNGAIGIYAHNGDGHDVMIRRHLALGGAVVCRKDRELLGDLADVCVDVSDYNGGRVDAIKPVDCAGSEKEYIEKVKEIVLES